MTNRFITLVLGVVLLMTKKYSMMRLMAVFLLALVLIKPAGAAGYLLEQGKGYAICEAFKKRLDKLGSLREPLPPERLRPFDYAVPGVKEAAWQDLDVEVHSDLFEKLVRYSTWNDAPWNQGSEIEKKRLSDTFIAQWRAEAKTGQVKLQMLRANIQLLDDAPETIARITRKYGPGKYEYTVIMCVVTDDLKDIDLAKQSRASWWPSGELVVYGSGHYLVAEDFLIESDFGNGLVTFCTINFDWKTRRKEMRK